LRELRLVAGVNLLPMEDIRPGLIICRVYRSGEEVVKTEKIIKL
jgi:hypothetical protein